MRLKAIRSRQYILELCLITIRAGCQPQSEPYYLSEGMAINRHGDHIGQMPGSLRNKASVSTVFQMYSLPDVTSYSRKSIPHVVGFQCLLGTISCPLHHDHTYLLQRTRGRYLQFGLENLLLYLIGPSKHWCHTPKLLLLLLH